MGNPIGYLDPSGHFTVTAIRDYLMAAYPDNWESVYTNWLADEQWFSMMSRAQAGDVLFGKVDGQEFRFQFAGRGQQKLSGFTVLKGAFTPLEYIRNGMHERIGGGRTLDGTPYSISRQRAEWEGIYRTGVTDENDLFPFHKHDVRFSRPSQGWEIAAMMPSAVVGGVIGFGVGLAICGATATIGCGLGVAVGFAIASTIVSEATPINQSVRDVMNVEAKDFYADVGEYAFHFQRESTTMGPIVSEP